MKSNLKLIKNGLHTGFTVLMSIYGKDNPDLLSMALSSIHENELKPDYIVLVIDGPVPENINQHINYARQAYKANIIKLEKNGGLANALNVGLSHINTEWVVRADADDFNLPHRFSSISEAIQLQPDLDLIGSSILEVEPDGTPVARREPPVHHEDICKFLLRRNPFNHMTVAYRKSFVMKCGGYPNIYLKEDYALWSIMINSGAKCANLPDVLVHATAGRDMYRRRGGLRYARAEIDLQALMIRLGLKSTIRGIFDGMARSSVFLAPSLIRRGIYEQFLRSR